MVKAQYPHNYNGYSSGHWVLILCKPYLLVPYTVPLFLPIRFLGLYQHVNKIRTHKNGHNSNTNINRQTSVSVCC